MTRRYLIVVAVMTLVSLPAVHPNAQDRSAPLTSSGPKSWTPPRTPWGDPDLEGIWNNTTTTPLEAPGGESRNQVFTEDETLRAQGANPGTYNDFWRDTGTGSRQAALVVDPPNGIIPPLTPQAKKREADRVAARQQRGDADSYLDRNRWERCLTRSLPMFPGSYNNNFQILQIPGYVVIQMEMVHDVRIIPVDGRPHGNIRTWLGDSRGRWEGLTLVVDTINFNDKLDGGAIMPSHRGNMFAHRGSGETLHMIERFTRTDQDTVSYEFTMDDPATFAKPWTVRMPMNRGNGEIYEYACHEGNYAMVGILRGARAQEKSAGSRDQK